MRVQELTAEEDLPIIFDIVKAKVEAGEKVILDLGYAGKIYKLSAVTHLPHDSVYAARLGWMRYDRDTPNTKAFWGSTDYSLAETKKWKLVKQADGCWELTT
jgi:hypothetical protein